MRTVVQMVIFVLAIAPAVFTLPHQAAAKSAHVRGRRTVAGYGDAKHGVAGVGLGLNLGGANGLSTGLGTGVLGGSGLGHVDSHHSSANSHSGGAHCTNCHQVDQFCAGGNGASVNCCNGTYCRINSDDDQHFFYDSSANPPRYYGLCAQCPVDRNCAYNNASDPENSDCDANGENCQCCYDSTCPPCTSAGQTPCNSDPSNYCFPDTSSTAGRRRREISGRLANKRLH